MLCNGAYSRKTAHHDSTNVCGPTRIHCWELVCCEGSGGAEKGERSLPLHFCKPLSIESTYKIRKILRFLVDCESSRIAMGSRDDTIHHGDISYYIGYNWCQRWCLSYMLRDIKNESGWRTCSKARREMT